MANYFTTCHLCGTHFQGQTATNLCYGCLEEVFYQEQEKRKQTEAELETWAECGDSIMEAVCGEKAPLSDSDIIKEFNKLKHRCRQLEEIMEAARDIVGSATPIIERGYHGPIINRRSIPNDQYLEIRDKLIAMESEAK